MTRAALSWTARMNGVSTVSTSSRLDSPISFSLEASRPFSRSRAWFRLPLDWVTADSQLNDAPLDRGDAGADLPGGIFDPVLLLIDVADGVGERHHQLANPVGVMADGRSLHGGSGAARRQRLHLFRQVTQRRIDLLGRRRGLAGKRLDLMSHHGEAAPGLAGRAASIVALSASRLVCLAMALISLATRPTRLSASVRSPDCFSIAVTSSVRVRRPDSALSTCPRPDAT